MTESNGRQTQDPLPDLEIETDASLQGWGAYCAGECTGGCWSDEEKTYHINALELLGATFGIMAFCKHNRVRSVFLLTDNTTVVAHINRMGGTRSPFLVQFTKNLWQWCLDRGVQLSAQHLPGKKNLRADYLSRYLRDRSDWVLDAELFGMINSRLGPLEVDLFTTRFSARLPRFFTWRPDPMGEATDALAQDWSGFLGYANPPWCLVARTLQKVRAQEATIVIVVPLWPMQAWFPQLNEMLVDFPVLLPHNSEILTPSPNCDGVIPDNVPQLIACKVSGSASKQEVFQKKLSSSYSPHGGARQRQTTTQPGGSGRPGVSTKMSIPLMQICDTS